jgi:class 3 adenylate cyclase/predicted ATPase
VLFCDLVDSTRLAAQLDPEDWREVVRGYQASAAEVIGRFDGHVAQYLGDGLVVYFGYPRAHEDDPERAVRAGLDIVPAMGELNELLERERNLRLSVRIGIHTGPVVVGEMGSGERTETLALGDTTNVAARIQEVAEPDTVVLSGATLRLVRGVFLTHDLGERSLKGITTPFRLYRSVRASGVRSRLDVASAAGLTPLVGREQEVGVLEDRWAQVQEGRGQVVLISGDAGIGKSRLVEAFRERLAERPHTWLECSASPYTQDSPLYPVLDLQRFGLGFLPDDLPGEKLQKLEAGLETAGFEPAQAVPVLAAFHGLPLPERYDAPSLSPEGQRKKTLDLMSEWLLRLGQQQSVVMVAEDLHWLDPSTLELLGTVMEQAPTAQILLLLTCRPDFEPPWGSRSHLTPMMLARLTHAQLGDLVRKAARGRDLPDEWVEEIVRRSDGVPLFAEELTKVVPETNPQIAGNGKAPELHIPETLQDSLMARLDQLGPVKELAQLGAVLGREFTYEILIKVSPLKEEQLREALAEAVREELFYQRGTPPEATYLFKHALIRDAAYQSLLRATRQHHHFRVAETLIHQMPEVAGTQPELVAHHLTEASDAERAISYWQQAGEQANARVAHEEAIRHVHHGLALLDDLAEGKPRTERELAFQVVLGRALTAARGYAHEETRRAWERARALCDPDAEPLRIRAICWGLGGTYVGSGDPRSGYEQFAQLHRIAEQAGDELWNVAGLNGCAVADFFLGRFRKGLEHAERATALYDPDRHRFHEVGFSDNPGVGSFGWASWAQWHLGFPARAWTTAREGVEIARRTGSGYGLTWALAWAAWTAAFRREPRLAEKFGAEAAVLAVEHHFPLLEAVGGLAETWGARFLARDPEAVDRFDRAMEQAAATGNQGAAPLILNLLVELRLADGRLEEAAATVDTALAVAGQTDQPFRDAELHRLKGEILLQMNHHAGDEAEALFQKALDIARSQEAKSLELRAATSLARLWQRQGKKDEARTLLQPIYDWFTEGFDTQDLKDTKALLDALS